MTRREDDTVYPSLPYGNKRRAYLSSWGMQPARWSGVARMELLCWGYHACCLYDFLWWRYRSGMTSVQAECHISSAEREVERMV